MGIPIRKIVEWAEKLNGIKYVFAAENDRKPVSEIEREDCSELIQNACDQNSVVPRMPDGAKNQYHHCHDHGTLISVQEAIDTYGALLFRIADQSHVAFSMGDGHRTFEAKGSRDGVGYFDNVADRPWTHGALIPGADYPGWEVS